MRGSSLSLALTQDKIRKETEQFWDKLVGKLVTTFVPNPPVIVWDSISPPQNTQAEVDLQFDDLTGHMDLVLVEEKKERVNWLKEGF